MEPQGTLTERLTAMADNKKEADHWRELAEMLGLPPEQTGNSRSARVSVADERTTPAPVHLEKGPPSPVPPSPVPPSPVAGSPVTGNEIEPVEESREWVVETIAETETRVEVNVRAAAQPKADNAEAADEDRPRRGRRRGRHGRRERGEERAAESRDVPEGNDESEEASPGLGADLEDERSEAGHLEESEPEADEDRAAEDLAAEEGIEEDVDESEGSRDTDEDEDDVEVDHLKNWNVPSWNDLIASLYRPDR